MSCERCILLAFLFVALLFPANGQDSQPLDAKTKQLVERIAKASSVKEAALANKALFNTKDRNLIRRLKNVSEKGVAIRAAWEEVALAGFKKELRKNPFGSEKETCLAVNQTAVSRFFGFVEGKLGIQPPPWWEEAVASASISRAWWEEAKKMPIPEGTIEIHPGVPKKSPYHYLKFDDDEIAMPKSMTIQKKEDGALLRIGKESMLLPSTILEEHWNTRICASMNQDRCFFAFPSIFSASFSLVCLDRQSGKKLWQTTVWDGGNIGGTGIWYEYVAVVDNGKSVFVFGSGTLCFFIEALDCKTGRNEFRFASRYWDELPRPKLVDCDQ
jgi:hypothetical protein